MSSRVNQPYSNRAEPARGSSLHTIKTQQKAKEEEEKIKMKRRKGIVTLMLQFCQEMGYSKSLDALQQESGLTIGKSTVAADNIDLLNVVTEYEDYYEYRFGKKPKLYRAPDAGEVMDSANAVGFDGGEGMLGPRPTAGRRAGGGGGGVATPPPSATPSSGYGNVAPPAVPATAPASNGRSAGALAVNGKPSSDPTGKDKGGASSSAAANNDGGLGIGGNAIKLTSQPGGGGIDNLFKKAKEGAGGGADDDDDEFGGMFQGGRALKPMPRFLTQELAELAGSIQRDILDTNPNVRFDHIADLTVAKDLLKEAVVMPIKYPELFAGILRPWRGVLLYGPPGTGKTMLAKAVATECKTTFFNISASSIVSKWRGDSEKLVRMLFDLAVHYAPSTIFIDELDSIMSARSSDGSEHEGSRRMKTELLIQIDGLSKRKNGDIVFVLGASNVPWDLDSAILRRLEKRILVTLPTESGRVAMFRHNLSATSGNSNRKRGGAGGGDAASAAAAACPLTEEELVTAAKATNGYSGADIDIVCREASMRTIRKVIKVLEARELQGGIDMHAPLSRPSVTLDDVMASIQATNPSTHHSDMGKFEQWAENFGSTMS